MIFRAALCRRERSTLRLTCSTHAQTSSRNRRSLFIRCTCFIAPCLSNDSAAAVFVWDTQASQARHATASCRVCIAFVAHFIRSRPAACLSPSCCLAESNDRQLRQPRNNDRRRSETNARRSEETLLASSATNAAHVRHDAATLRDAIVRTTRCTRRSAI